MNDDVTISITEFVELNDNVRATLRQPGDNDAPFRFDSSIRQIFETRLLIDVPPGPEFDLLLKPGRPIEVEFLKGQQNMPIINTTIVTFNRQGLSTGCWIMVPADFKEYFLKRRSHVRIPVRVPLKVFYRVDGVPQIVQAETMNLSGGGLRFIAQKTFAIHEAITLEFFPESGAPVCKLDAEVVLCKPSPYRTPKNMSEMMVAVRFTNLTRSQEDRLVGICFRKEMQQLKHLKDD